MDESPRRGAGTTMVLSGMLNFFLVIPGVGIWEPDVIDIDNRVVLDPRARYRVHAGILPKRLNHLGTRHSASNSG